MQRKKGVKNIFFVIPFLMGLFVSLGGSSVSAASYSVSLSTSGAVNLDVTNSGNGANVATDNLNIISTCPFGYDVLISGPSDTALYKDGDSTSTSKINPSTGTSSSPVSILDTNRGTWGYSTVSSSITGTFAGLTNEQAVLSTSSTGTSSTGTTLPVYYGVSVGSDLASGTYTMAESTIGAGDNVISYYLTASLDCTSYTVEFNPTSTATGSPISGTGTMTSQRITEGVTTALASNAFTAPTGYEFKEWNTTQDGTGTSYADEAQVTDLTTLGSTITLYAQWTAPAYLDTGQTVNQKLKRLAGNSSATYSTQDTTITALARSATLPNGFTPSNENTISTSTSAIPIYAWYDSTNATIYYYSEAQDIKMNLDSGYFFNNMRALSDLSTISSWDTSKVKDVSNMFHYAGRNATTWSVGDLSSWDTSKVTNMSYMFSNAGRNATTWSVGDLSSWDTSSVTNMSYMFEDAGYSATTWSVGDLSSWNISKVESMASMFAGAGYNATTFTLDLSSWDTSNATYISHMFTNAGYSATAWSIGNLSSWNTSSVTKMQSMFENAGHSATTWSVGDLSSWDTSKVTAMSSMFYGAGYKATTLALDLSSWDTSSVTDMSYMFRNVGYSATTWSVGDLSSWNTSSVTNMQSMFYYASYSATTWSVGDLSSWDTSKVTTMSNMFDHAGYSATTWSVGDLSSWDTSKVTNMSYMFADAGRNATTWSIGNLSSWGTSKVTNMSYMFSSAGRSATTWSVGDLSSWNTSSVTNIQDMFVGAGYNATTFTLDLSSWDTSKVTNMSYMFSNAGRSATTWSVGDLSSWDTSKVTKMNSMFSYAGNSAAIFTLDLSSWDTSSVTNMSDMFSYAGYSATTWSVTIPKTNDGTVTGPISNTTARLYGNSTSVYATPPSGRSFTLAN